MSISHQNNLAQSLFKSHSLVIYIRNVLNCIFQNEKKKKSDENPKNFFKQTYHNSKNNDRKD